MTRVSGSGVRLVILVKTRLAKDGNIKSATMPYKPGNVTNLDECVVVVESTKVIGKAKKLQGRKLFSRREEVD